MVPHWRGRAWEHDEEQKVISGSSSDYGLWLELAAASEGDVELDCMTGRHALNEGAMMSLAWSAHQHVPAYTQRAY